MLKVTRDLVRLFLELKPEYRLRRGFMRLIPTRSKRKGVNIVHAGVWKTGSQWFRLILSDPRIYIHDGRLPFVWPELRDEEHSRKKFNERGGAKLLACFGHHATVQQMISGMPFRAIFVVRHPRDLLLSWYFSTRYTHVETPTIRRHRSNMEGMSDEDGIIYLMQAFVDEFLPVLSSWTEAAMRSNRIRIIHFEDITTGGEEAWMSIFDHLEIDVPLDTVRRVLNTYHISKIGAGRGSVKASQSSQKYVNAGRRDQSDYFTDRVLREYNALMPSLASDLGYPEDSRRSIGCVQE